MFAASTYEEIERIERQVENMEIVVFLFARPTEEKILREFEYIHYNSAKYCSIYAIGYTDDFTKAEEKRPEAEGLSEEELEIFDLLLIAGKKLTKDEEQKVKLSAKNL